MLKMDYLLTEPMYFVGQDVLFIHHNGSKLDGKIMAVETHYNIGCVGYHIYGIHRGNNKCAFWIGEKKIISIINATAQ